MTLGMFPVYCLIVAAACAAVAGFGYVLFKSLRGALSNVSAELTRVSKLVANLQAGSEGDRSHSDRIEKLTSVEILAITKEIRQLGSRLQNNFGSIDWNRWIPLATNETYIKAYFDFSNFERFNDTTGKRVRNFSMAALLDLAVKSGRVTGDVAECGCYMGHTAFVIATILKAGSFSGVFHIFDSFEGLSDADEEDVRPFADGPETDELRKLAGQAKDGSRQFRADLDRVRRNLAGFNFIDFHPGWIPTKFHEVEDRSFSFVNIDVDLYQPTLQSLEFFYPRLSDGGMINIDDFGLTSWPGCNRAVDKWLESNTPRLTIPIPGGGLILIK
jgi:hypothetical protein